MEWCGGCFGHRGYGCRACEWKTEYVALSRDLDAAVALLRDFDTLGSREWLAKRYTFLTDYDSRKGGGT